MLTIIRNYFILKNLIKQFEQLWNSLSLFEQNAVVDMYNYKYIYCSATQAQKKCYELIFQIKRLSPRYQFAFEKGLVLVCA